MDELIDARLPPPLAPLEHIVISPENMALEARLDRIEPLSKSEYNRMLAQARKLRSQLVEHNYKGLLEEKAELLRTQAILQEYVDNINIVLTNNPEDAYWLQQYNQTMDELQPVNDKLQLMKKLYYSAYAVYLIEQRLADEPLVRQRWLEDQSAQKAMHKEAQIYKQIIIDRWTRMGFKHEYKRGDKTYVEKVKIESVDYSQDAIYYKIGGSFMTLLGGYKTLIPDGVKVGELIDEKTLFELSHACQRQVTAVSNVNGTWVVVHRLDTIDGLMSYVKFDAVMTRYPKKKHYDMPICIGVGLYRNIWWVSLSEYPHWLIAGYTKAGKSNLINVGICTLISRQSPDDLRLVLVDLKGGLEFSFYEGIPHLHRPIIDNVEQAAEALVELEAIMAQRFETLREAKVKNIEDFQIVNGPSSMPRLLFVFDEVASIGNHGDTTRRIIGSLELLVQKGRAVGIHIWFCTQRPEVKVIPGSIKANLSLRISGRMPDVASSQTVLGTSDAKDLAPILGRMAILIGSDIIQIQTPHITNQNVYDAIETAKTYAKPKPLPVPDIVVIDRQWTPEKIVELSIKHLKSNIGWLAVYEAIKDDVTREQARQLVEAVWEMPEIIHDGQQYKVANGKGRIKMLKKVETAELLNTG
jgi:DNA segregation ATPase FtsK/SpoIIIE-like protein